MMKATTTKRLSTATARPAARFGARKSVVVRAGGAGTLLQAVIVLSVTPRGCYERFVFVLSLKFIPSSETHRSGERLDVGGARAEEPGPGAG